VKLRVISLCLAIALPVFVAACQAGGTNKEATDTAASANAAAKPSPTKATVEEIRAVLAAHDKALTEKNLDAIMPGRAKTPPRARDIDHEGELQRPEHNPPIVKRHVILAEQEHGGDREQHDEAVGEMVERQQRPDPRQAGRQVHHARRTVRPPESFHADHRKERQQDRRGRQLDCSSASDWTEERTQLRNPLHRDLAVEIELKDLRVAV